jgi:hypothetical protein
MYCALSVGGTARRKEGEEGNVMNITEQIKETEEEVKNRRGERL